MPRGPLTSLRPYFPGRTSALAAAAAAGVAALFLPFILWLRQPARTLKVAVLDKTVGDTSYRDHAGLFWLLNHRKIRKPDGTDYRADTDYYGFFPLPGHHWDIREPSFAQAAPEFIYLADTYGVYTEEFYGQALGNRSTAIYGGLRPEEVQDLDAALPGCLTLVGEFNIFANPTTGDPRLACEAWFGLTWKGWTGRFFLDLDRTLEVPPWAVRNFERQTGTPWNFEGPGFLLVNEDDQVEVLEEGVDVEKNRGLRFRGRPAGIERLDLPADARYDYWFDLVQPVGATEVLADFELPLLPAGEQRLKALGLGRLTPAILGGWHGRTRTYYFSGDFVDAWPVPTVHRLAGFAPLRRTFTREEAGDPQSFFWRVYVPLMTHVVEETLERKHSGR